MHILRSSLIIAAIALPCPASVILTADGGVLNAERYEVNGDWATIYLEGQGMLMMPLIKISRIVDDQAALGLTADELSSTGLALHYSDKDLVPSTPFGAKIFATSKRHKISPKLVAALIQAESNFDPVAVSPKGARGLMQLMPATATRFGVQPDQLFDVEKNLEAGVRYLGLLIQRFPDDLVRVLAAYNAGESTVERYRGVPPYRETQDYIRRILKTLTEAR